MLNKVCKLVKQDRKQNGVDFEKYCALQYKEELAKKKQSVEPKRKTAKTRIVVCNDLVESDSDDDDNNTEARSLTAV